MVIVGAGLAGLSAAEALRSEGFDGRVVLIGEEPHLPYTKPPLSKAVLRGETTVAETAFRPAEWYVDNGIELVLGARATSIDPDRHHVELATGDQISYDKALLATGGRARTLACAGGHLDGVFTLRSIEDALAIKERLTPGAPIIVVGAGFIGAEVAASARMMGCEVIMLEIAPVPLSRVLGPAVGEIFSQIHREHGVNVVCGTGLDHIGGETHVTHVVTAEGARHDAAAVILGVGLVPDLELARSAGVRLADGAVVDERCRTSTPDLYAAGDIAQHPNPILGRSIRVEQWQNAQHQAQAAARSMLGGDKPFAEVPWFWSDQYDINLQMAGLPSATDRPVFRGDVEARSFSVFYLRDGVVSGVVGLNHVLDVRVGRKLIAQRAMIAPDPLADESTDLASLSSVATV
jgi:3-phenylpropionate/trans-cinnamate dioxygenase ferredoxin reductase subunit